MNEFKYILQPYKGPSSRVKCPSCNRNREFARYLDITTGELLPDHVGRCNREQHCGYHYTPKQYFADGGQRPSSQFSKEKPVSEPVKPIDFLPLAYVEQSTNKAYLKKNNFFLFLTSLFTEPVAMDLWLKYLLGTSSHWRGATIFWQIDTDERVRQCKIMLYDALTGKRIKQGAEVLKFDRQKKKHLPILADQDCTKIYGKYLDATTKELNLQQTFFGCHLIAEYPERTIAIVESEKTAMIASVYFPSLTWIATGGKFGCKWNDYAVSKVLAGRRVILFPDLGAFDKWSERAEQIQWQSGCKIHVSDLLERAATEEQRAKGLDLADYLITSDESTGLALKDGYPAMWDYKAA